MDGEGKITEPAESPTPDANTSGAGEQSDSRTAEDFVPEVCLMECGCCFSDTDVEQMVQCADAHLFCMECLKSYANEAIHGQGKSELCCMTADCKMTFPMSQMKRALSAELIQRFEERVQEESLNMANLTNLVRCPGCNYAAEIVDEEQKVFACTQCKKCTCRYCHIDWADHEGLTCAQVEKTDETSIRTKYEEMMTEAAIRQCPKCRAPLVKIDGCNKITCRCGKTICYMCRSPNIEYDHFCRHVGPHRTGCQICNKCLLWASGEENDKRIIDQLKEQGKLERLEKGFQDVRAIGAPEDQAGVGNNAFPQHGFQNPYNMIAYPPPAFFPMWNAYPPLNLLQPQPLQPPPPPPPPPPPFPLAPPPPRPRRQPRRRMTAAEKRSQTKQKADSDKVREAVRNEIVEGMNNLPNVNGRMPRPMLPALPTATFVPAHSADLVSSRPQAAAHAGAAVNDIQLPTFQPENVFLKAPITARRSRTATRTEPPPLLPAMNVSIGDPIVKALRLQTNGIIDLTTSSLGEPKAAATRLSTSKTAGLNKPSTSTTAEVNEPSMNMAAIDLTLDMGAGLTLAPNAKAKSTTIWIDDEPQASTSKAVQAGKPFNGDTLAHVERDPVAKFGDTENVFPTSPQSAIGNEIDISAASTSLPEKESCDDSDDDWSFHDATDRTANAATRRSTTEAQLDLEDIDLIRKQNLKLRKLHEDFRRKQQEVLSHYAAKRQKLAKKRSALKQ